MVGSFADQDAMQNNDQTHSPKEATRKRPCVVVIEDIQGDPKQPKGVYISPPPTDQPAILMVGSFADHDAMQNNDQTHSPKEATRKRPCAVVIEDIQGDPKQPKGCCGTKACRHGCPRWCAKYFWEGQHLEKRRASAIQMVTTNTPWHKLLLTKYRKVIAFLIPAFIVHFFWWAYMINFNYFYFFKEKYYMTLTMVFGGIVAGMTSEGGGAVAFPVLTLGFSVDTSVARDVAFMVQSFGMTCATFAILFMGVTVEWHAVIMCTLGGATGNLLGLHFVDPALSPQQKKMAFVSIWFAFASVLIFLNRTHKRRTFEKIPDFKTWKAVTLFVGGFAGGILTSFAGTGLDICSFSVLTLLFRVSEKIATPTSVILMSWNSLIGLYWNGVMLGAVSREAWEFGAVTMPVVVLGAPVGAVLGSHFHRLVLASFVIILDVLAWVTALVIVRPLPPELIGISVAITVIGCALFFGLTYAGQRMLTNMEEKEKQSVELKELSEDKKELPDNSPMHDMD